MGTRADIKYKKPNAIAYSSSSTSHYLPSLLFTSDGEAMREIGGAVQPIPVATYSIHLTKKKQENPPLPYYVNVNAHTDSLSYTNTQFNPPSFLPPSFTPSLACTVHCCHLRSYDCSTVGGILKFCFIRNSGLISRLANSGTEEGV